MGKKTASIKIKILIIVFSALFLITAILGCLSFYFSKNRLVSMLGDSTKGIAATVASSIEGWDLVLIRDNIDGIKEKFLTKRSPIFANVYEKMDETQKAGGESLDAAIKKYVKYVNLLSNVAETNKIDGPVNVYMKEGGRLKLILSSYNTMLAGSYYIMRQEAEESLARMAPRATGVYVDKDGTWISAFAPVSFPSSTNTEAVVEITNKIDIYFNRLKEELAAILLVCLFGFLGTAFFSYHFVNRIAAAIDKLNRAALQLEKENYSAAVEIDRDDEIGHLARTFEKLRMSIRDKIEQLRSALIKEKRAHLDSIIALTNAIDLRDPYTRQHLYRVDKYALLIAKAMGLERKQVEKLRYGCYLHDVGKIYIADSLLKKPRLSDAEFEEIRRHAENGARIVAGIPFLEDVTDVILYHQERYNGKGYPKGLKGEDIPFLARVVAVADAFDAMTSDRPYRARIGFKEAMDVIEKNAGVDFDPRICKAFLKYRNSIERIANKHF